jgi:uncharacterized protein YggT (Ycf19 family)
MAMDPDKVAADESRRVAQHERIKGKLEEDVHARIEREASQAGPSEQAEVKAVASQLKHKATSEVAQTERELERARGTLRVSQVVDYVFYLAYGLIGLEIVLELLGARQAATFKRFLDTVTWPLLAPFRGLMPDPAVGSFQLMLSYIVALIVYFLLHRSLIALMRIFAERKATL